MRFARGLHGAADRFDRSMRPMINRSRAVERAWVAVLDAIVARQSDRVHLRNVILPAIARGGLARVLFVGVRGYTRSYGEAFQGTSTEFWTSDIDPAAAPCGAPGRHVIGDACRLDEAFPDKNFDLVVMNGVFGWGLDDPAGMDRAVVAAHRVLAPGGWLLLGWNADRIADPDTLPAIAGLFAPAAFGRLPPRTAFPDVTHVYAWYRRA